MIRIVKTPLKKSEFEEMAREEFGDMVKMVIDIEQEIMAVGGELHSDEEIVLVEQEDSRRENTWGVNLYPKKPENEWLEFDSMINLKPAFGNRSRGVENGQIRDKIKNIVRKLIID